MRVRYKVTIYGDLAESARGKPEDIHAVMELGVEFCCESMKEFWGRAVTLGDIYYDSEERDMVGIYDCEPCYGESPGFHPIEFCPFCGAKIEREVAERYTMKKHETTETVTRTRYEPEKAEAPEETPTI